MQVNDRDRASLAQWRVYPSVAMIWSMTADMSDPAMVGCLPRGLRTIPGRATKARLTAGGQCAGDIPRVRGDQPDLADADAAVLRDGLVWLRGGLEVARAIG